MFVGPDLLLPSRQVMGLFARHKPHGAQSTKSQELECAFGKRTLHIDLIYSRPVAPGSEPHHHAGIKQIPNGHGEVLSAIENRLPVRQTLVDQDITPNHTMMSAYLDGTAVSDSAHSAKIGLRLDSITSFEIIWDFAPWLGSQHSIDGDDRQQVASWNLETFEWFMDVIPDLFPNIKKLYIALQGDIMPKLQGLLGRRHASHKERVKLVATGITQKVDDMAARVNPNVDLSVAFPTSTYAVHRRLAPHQSMKVIQRHETGDIERYWRPLKDCLPRTGYWFCLGERDLKTKNATHLLGRKVMPPRPRGEEYDVFFRPGRPCV
ncbi:hypothetical protein FSARC_12359 [Fusarium sarcochroum]|uniref:Uncharacterized protein n=1 Tax=Fusarium sarcochroum TaxID=1208366 RepID=A0A8H4T8Z8_9HYPO|nr:hypothetical protein FSARC_12359 [Fusarium sarcochroum]